MISQHCAPLNAPAPPSSPCWQGLGAVGLSPAAPVPGPAMGLLADREVPEGRQGRALEAAERGRTAKRGHFPTEREDAPKATLPELPKPSVSLGVPELCQVASHARDVPMMSGTTLSSCQMLWGPSMQSDKTSFPQNHFQRGTSPSTRPC